MSRGTTSAAEHAAFRRAAIRRGINHLALNVVAGVPGELQVRQPRLGSAESRSRKGAASASVRRPGRRPQSGRGWAPRRNREPERAPTRSSALSAMKMGMSDVRASTGPIAAAPPAAVWAIKLPLKCTTVAKRLRCPIWATSKVSRGRSGAVAVRTCLVFAGTVLICAPFFCRNAGGDNQRTPGRATMGKNTDARVGASKAHCWAPSSLCGNDTTLVCCRQRSKIKRWVPGPHPVRGREGLVEIDSPRCRARSPPPVGRCRAKDST